MWETNIKSIFLETRYMTILCPYMSQATQQLKVNEWYAMIVNDPKIYFPFFKYSYGVIFVIFVFSRFLRRLVSRSLFPFLRGVCIFASSSFRLVLCWCVFVSYFLRFSIFCFSMCVQNRRRTKCLYISVIRAFKGLETPYQIRACLQQGIPSLRACPRHHAQHAYVHIFVHGITE